MPHTHGSLLNSLRRGSLEGSTIKLNRQHTPLGPTHLSPLYSLPLKSRWASSASCVSATAAHQSAYTAVLKLDEGETAHGTTIHETTIAFEELRVSDYTFRIAYIFEIGLLSACR
jgi:hypothetical protein